MAIAKKGTRKIVVNQETFLWKIKRKPTYSQIVGDQLMIVSVQHQDHEQGSILVLHLPYGHPESIFPEKANITPKMIQGYIQDAIVLGWQYDEPGKPFEHHILKPL